ncbi:hypothetical protein Pan161_00820 [Gimesia algae]|uniref:Uncharacterized protein n=1 Tax=Gimesia algae TaxID=2527971 RepID=A0A517V635_9PLAN|nr:hypothetical protein Pan161_00820 [Gimesia algae]
MYAAGFGKTSKIRGKAKQIISQIRSNRNCVEIRVNCHCYFSVRTNTSMELMFVLNSHEVYLLF